MIAAALERGDRRGRRARAGLAGDPQPLRRGDRHERQDDDGRAARAPLPRPPASRSRSPATSARRCPSLAGEVDADATVVCEASSFQLEDTERLRARVRDLPQPRPRPPRPPRATSTPTWRRSCGSSPTRATTTSPSTTPTSRRWPASTSAAARAASPSAMAPAPDCEVALAEGTIFDDGEPLLAVDELGLLGEHNVANAMAAAAAALSMGLDRDAVREGLRSFAGVPHRLEPVAEIAGVRFVNDSKATNVASATVGLARLRRRRPRDPRRQREGRAVRAARRPGPRALRRLLPDRRLRRRASPRSWRRWSRPASRCTAATDLEDAVRRAAAAAAPGEAVLLSPACASFDAFETSSSAASASARSSRSSRERAVALRRARRRRARRKREEGRKRSAARRSDRVQPAADRDPLPAGASAR